MTGPRPTRRALVVGGSLAGLMTGLLLRRPGLGARNTPIEVTARGPVDLAARRRQ